MKGKKVGKLLRSLLVYALLILIAVVALDFYRAPDGRALNNTPLTTTDGKRIDFFNQETPAILYFWGSWCIYCRHTSPTIDALYQEGYPVVTVAMQSGSDDQVQTYLDEHGWQFPVVNDQDGSISEAFSVVATPTIAIIHNGQMRITTSGWTSKPGLKLRLWLLSLTR